ncbi:MAG: hypothetical protein IKH26_05220 [Bacteroidaceae bacterium]|nr:hypothetical protein [Bacteroidaceae bacterium]
MRHPANLLLLILLALSIHSCQKEEDDIPLSPILPPGLVDGGKISSINLYCLEKDVPQKGIWFNYYPKIKTIKDYSNIQLCLMVDTNIPLRESEDSEERSFIRKMEANYHSERISAVLNISKDDGSYIDKGYLLDGFMTAYVDGEAELTCDKTLFGEPPGTNLSKYFYTLNNLIPIGVERPKMLHDMDFETPVPEPMNNFFQNEAWIRNKYYMELQSLPAERYNELTLHMTIPMKIEHVRDYMLSSSRGDSIAPRYTEQTFEADCLIKFEWDE